MLSFYTVGYYCTTVLYFAVSFLPGFRLLVTLLIMVSQMIQADVDLTTTNSSDLMETFTEPDFTYSILNTNRMAISQNNETSSGRSPSTPAPTCDTRNSLFQQSLYDGFCSASDSNLTIFGNISDVEQSIRDFQSVLQRFDCWCPHTSPAEDNEDSMRAREENSETLYVTYSHFTSCQQCLVC